AGSGVWSFYISSEPGTPPSTPTNVTATAGDEQVTISWENVSGATSYNIYWATSSGVTKSTGTKITNVSSPYTHTGLTNGTTYYYIVTAENSYGESDESSEVNAESQAPDITAPPAPIDLVATPSSWSNTNSFSINWTNPSDASGIQGAYYKLGSAPTSNTDGTYTTDKPFTVSATGEGEVTIYVWLKDGVSNIDYNNNSSAMLHYDATAPSAPTVTGTSPTNDTTPTWDWRTGGGGNGTFRYKLDKSDLATGAIETTSTSFTPAPALSAGSHTLYVQERDDAGNWSSSGSSAIVIDTTAPTDGTLEATAGDEEISLAWWGFSDTMSGISSYTLVYSTSGYPSSCSAGTQIHSGTGTSYNHAALINGTTYYYRVCATDNAGNTSSGSTTSEMPGIAPSPPTNVSTTAGDAEVTISWNNVSGATSYNIYWSTSSGVTKSAGTKITNVSSPYTHTGRTNGTTYYYVVTAENTYGESDESEEVNATPLSTWTMLKLPDTGQTQSYTDVFGEDSDYTINSPSYTDNGDGTVTDNVTGLMWQQEDDDTTRTWDEACSYCDDLTLGGYSDWRLPSVMELICIVNYGTYNPSIDTTYFSGTNAAYYWSATAYALDSADAWCVGFNDGNADNVAHIDHDYVRCVRSGQ
ncbi:MAG: DUF1566 domain-containing protein, partial [Armatimonadetes bacterium]|nr:DUF1566 domain-containing protein [Armatimonadota bacterium]